MTRRPVQGVRWEDSAWGRAADGNYVIQDVVVTIGFTTLGVAIIVASVLVLCGLRRNAVSYSLTGAATVRPYLAGSPRRPALWPLRRNTREPI